MLLGEVIDGAGADHMQVFDAHALVLKCMTVKVFKPASDSWRECALHTAAYDEAEMGGGLAIDHQRRSLIDPGN